jgi:hypothetical protein
MSMDELEIIGQDDKIYFKWFLNNILINKGPELDCFRFIVWEKVIQTFFEKFNKKN